MGAENARILDGQQVAGEPGRPGVALAGVAETVIVRRCDTGKEEMVGVGSDVTWETQRGGVESEADGGVIQLDAGEAVTELDQVRGAEREGVIDGGAVVGLRLVVGRALRDPDGGRQFHRRGLVQAQARITDEETAAVAEVLVQLDIHRIRVLDGGCGDVVVVGSGKGQPRLIRRRIVIDDVIGYRIDAVGGDDVPGERGAHVARALRHSGVGDRKSVV